MSSFHLNGAKSDFAARVRASSGAFPTAASRPTATSPRQPAGRARIARSATSCASTSDSSVPCHRVIAAGGKLGGYGRDLFAKRALLLAEGVIVVSGRPNQETSRRFDGNGPERARLGIDIRKSANLRIFQSCEVCEPRQPSRPAEPRLIFPSVQS